MSEVNLAKVDLNLLVALDVLLEERHVTNAANRLGLSQSAMSRNLSRLRQVFDDPLLVRTAAGYVRTPRADEIAASLRPVLSGVQAILEKPTFDPASATGAFRISALDYPEIAILPALMQRVRTRAPAVRIEVVYKSILSIEEVVEGRADVAIGLMPTSLPKHCRIETLYEDEYVCVMHKSHPLANTRMTLDDYIRYPHSVIHTGKAPGSFVDDLLAKQGLERQIVKYSPHFVTSVLSIRETDLIQTAPKRLALPLLDAAGLVMQELPFQMKPVVVSQLWHARNTSNPLHQWFRDQIAQVAREAPDTA